MTSGRDRLRDGPPPPSVLALGSATQDRLRRFLGLVQRWNQATNLVSGRCTAHHLWRLVDESLQAAPYLPEGVRVLDVGSGAGIPAIPLLVARSDITGVLLEVRERRWAFLREAVRELELPADARRQRLEDVGDEKFGAVTVRGVERSMWQRGAARVLASGGVVIWWTAARRAREADLPGRVLVCPMLGAEQGAMLVWNPCFT